MQKNKNLIWGIAAAGVAAVSAVAGLIFHRKDISGWIEAHSAKEEEAVAEAVDAEDIAAEEVAPAAEEAAPAAEEAPMAEEATGEAPVAEETENAE